MKTTALLIATTAFAALMLVGCQRMDSGHCTSGEHVKHAAACMCARGHEEFCNKGE